MRTLLVAIFLLGSVGLASASDGIVAQCREAFPEPADKASLLSCINVLSQQAVANQMAQLQQNQARQQAAGMALFGSGPAMINGMNQGMQNMQVHPYVLPPAQNYMHR